MTAPARRPLAAALVLSLAAVLALPAASGAEEAPSVEALQAEIQALRQELRRLEAQAAAPADADRSAELERRIDLLAAEIEKSRTGGAAGTAATAETGPVPGFGPAASKVYRAGRGVSIGGYGEAVYQNFAARREDGTASGKADTIDFVRAIVYVGYKFSDRMLFNSELEVEHATTGEGDEEKGEVSLEFGYLEFRPWAHAGFRAGMLLVPLGFTNELHEAPVFHGARRPDVERAILPTTWRENGAGVFGASGPFEWRAFVMAGLNSEGFEASGIREGRQGGAESLAESLALTGRLDFTGVHGLLLGGSFWAGGSGQGAGFDGQVTILDAHVQYERRGLRLRGLYAHTAIGDAAAINEQNGFAGAESVGERQSGAYVEAAYDLMTLHPRGEWSLTPFVRYERYDTQQRVPAGYASDPANDRTGLTVGVGVKPVPNVVLKADYQWLGNEADTGTNQFNVGIGYLF